jgi:undecaprenyl-diphosphatase
VSTLQAVLLGMLQGLTEFLPISSSAHLVAAQAALGVEAPGVLLEVALHFGTLLAVLVVFWRRLCAVVLDFLIGCRALAAHGGLRAALDAAPLFPTGVAIVAGTAPAVCVGLAFGDSLEAAFQDLALTGALLMATGLVLLSLRGAAEGGTTSVGPGRGLMIGIAQAAALLPGISRSGITIVTARHLGVESGASARFSFLLAVPALVGASAWELGKAAPDLLSGPAEGGEPLVAVGALAAGTLAAALVGTVCLLVLLRLLRQGRLHWFAAYCLPAGALMVAAGLLR